MKPPFTWGVASPPRQRLEERNHSTRAVAAARPGVVALSTVGVTQGELSTDPAAVTVPGRRHLDKALSYALPAMLSRREGLPTSHAMQAPPRPSLHPSSACGSLGPCVKSQPQTSGSEVCISSARGLVPRQEGVFEENPRNESMKKLGKETGGQGLQGVAGLCGCTGGRALRAPGPQTQSHQEWAQHVKRIPHSVTMPFPTKPCPWAPGPACCDDNPPGEKPGHPNPGRASGQQGVNI